MKTILAKTLVALSIVGIAGILFGLPGCGTGASNNDQGTSFLALGFFDDFTGDSGRAGEIVPLFTDIADSEIGSADGRAILAIIGLQNRLSTQFLRVVRVDCSYDVQGSQISVPNDSFNFSSVLGPAGDAADENLPAIRFQEFEIVSPDIFSFLNINQNLLPQLPFRMTVTCNATGITQAGDTLTTNDVQYFIQFVDEPECCTGAPDFPTGPGTGGDLNTTEGIAAENQPATGASTDIVVIDEGAGSSS